MDIMFFEQCDALPGGYEYGIKIDYILLKILNFVKEKITEIRMRMYSGMPGKSRILDFYLIKPYIFIQ